MHTQIIAVTKPVNDITLEQFIVQTARVSNQANQGNHETADKLLRYLILNKHWSPFEMASVTIEIDTTRDIARQMLRHRSFSFQEFSQRYSDDIHFETAKARRQDSKNRQNSIDDLTTDCQDEWQTMQDNIIGYANSAYKSAIAKGIAKECARKILPEGLTISRLYMSGTIRSWIHYLEQRCDKATQLEHREVAISIRNNLHEIAPLIFPISTTTTTTTTTTIDL